MNMELLMNGIGGQDIGGLFEAAFLRGEEVNSASFYLLLPLLLSI